MRLELTGRHLSVTPAVRRLVERRLAHVTRMLNDSALSAQVVLTKEKTRIHIDATLHARGEHFFHGEATGRDLQSALAAAADKLDHQVQKLKGKWQERKRRRVPASRAPAGAVSPERRGAGPGDRLPRIVRSRRYAVKPMTIEDAVAEIGDGNDGVIVFRNAATDAITVLFRRTDGNIGLIEPEA
ncbi:MAG TPA: ribosome-associated translation inhibitor RaiA [Vicinamibacterales bacterium]|nr:ribosome-associated translation inhibitor RaiA [Vicinamibacterales bacterium]